MLSRIFIVIVGLFLVPQVADAKVRGISGSQKFVSADGISGEKAIVRCLTGSQPRTIVRMDGVREWCDSEVKSICRANKLNAAKKVCSSSYRRALDEQLTGQPVAEPAKVTTKVEPAKPAQVEPVAAPVKVDSNAAQSELLEIEQKRVQIRQRQLELRKRELELEKQRAADIESGF